MKKIIFFILLLILPLVSAQYDWKQYGNSWTPMWNQQLSGGYGRFDAGVNVSSVIDTYYPTTNHIQPLISNLDTNASDPLFKEYLIFPIANYLRIYDKFFTFYDEITTNGNVVGQIATVDWNRDGKTTEVVGLWDGNVFEAFQYNTTSNKYTLKATLNLSASPYNFSVGSLFGVRSSGYNTYMIGKDVNNSIWFLTANSSNGSAVEISQVLINQSGFTSLLSYEEPLSWYDINGDGLLEFLYYDSRQVLVFSQNGSILFWKNLTVPDYYTGASFVQVDATGQWRIATLRGATGVGYGAFTLTVYRQDGSTLWTKTVLTGTVSYVASHCRMAVSDDYDDDTFNNDDDIYVACYFSFSGLGHRHYYKIYKGYNGNLLMNYEDSGYIAGTPSSIPQLTIADMNHDGKSDFISSMFDGTTSLFIWDSVANSSLYSASMGSEGSPSCIPADLNVDGFQEVICQSNAKTYLYYAGNISNSLPTISSVSYDPSTNIQVGTTLYMTISASDSEGNAILYSSRCSNDDNWTTDSYASTQNCLYSSVGSYNNSVRVRDAYHTDYNTFSQQIIVSTTGGTCNNNGICESDLGETIDSCPADCEEEETVTSIEGTEIPTKLVDADDEEAGFLPLVYRSVLTFFSAILIPLIWIVFGIFIALIIITIFGILRKLVNKIG